MKQDPSGFVVLSRKFFQSELWLEPRELSRAEAWIDLIQLAQWRDRVFETKRYGSIELKRGEFVGSVRRLAKRWKWSEKRVRTFLKAAQQKAQVRAQREAQAGTVYLIVNYDLYQQPLIKGAQQKAQRKAQRKAQEQSSNNPNTSYTQGSDAPASNPTSLDRLPKSTADQAFRNWGARLGAINYPRLRNALLGCVDAGVPQEQLPDAVEAYADWHEGLSDRDKQFNTPSPERFAAEGRRWARLGQMGYADLDGPTERGRLLLTNDLLKTLTRGAA